MASYQWRPVKYEPLSVGDLFVSFVSTRALSSRGTLRSSMQLKIHCCAFWTCSDHLCMCAYVAHSFEWLSIPENWNVDPLSSVINVWTQGSGSTNNRHDIQNWKVLFSLIQTKVGFAIYKDPWSLLWAHLIFLTAIVSILTTSLLLKSHLYISHTSS